MTPWEQITATKYGTQFRVALSGMQKQGKTHVCFTAPQPLYIFNFNDGLVGVQEKFIRTGTEAFVSKYTMPLLSMNPQAEAQLEWDKWEKDMAALIDTVSKDKRPAGQKGTVIFDTHTEHNQLQRLKEWGKLTANAQHYTVINTQYKAYMRQIQNAGLNAIYLSTMKEKYVGSQSTGQYEPRQWNELSFEVDANLQAWRGQDGIFHVSIIDCRFNPNVAGYDLYDNGQGVLPNMKNVLWSMFSDYSHDPPSTPDLSVLKMVDRV